jgi:hypothetical protein
MFYAMHGGISRLGGQLHPGSFVPFRWGRVREFDRLRRGAGIRAPSGGTAYAPAAGRLAAAMATIKARRRPIRDGVERSNERNRRISQIPLAPAENNVSRNRRLRKMVPPERPVEGAAKIATRLSGDDRFTVESLPQSSRPGPNFLCKNARLPARSPGPDGYPGVNPKIRSKRPA